MTAVRAVAASALALAVILLAPVASADGDAPTAQEKAGLPLRPNKPLSMAPAESSGASGLWKLALAGVLAAGGVWLYKRRAKNMAGAAPAPKIRVVTRTQLAMRSELVVVEVDGATMLLGVTPHAIQLVTTLGDAAAPEVSRGAPELEPLRPAPAATPARMERQVAGLLRMRGGG